MPPGRWSPTAVVSNDWILGNECTCCVDTAAAVDTEPPEGDSENQAKFLQRAGSTKDLIVPTGRMYANMWQPGFWQEWNPMLWCYGDCVYGDAKLYEEPYKQPTFK